MPSFLKYLAIVVQKNNFSSSITYLKSWLISFNILGVRTFQAWMRYRYGVFSEVGFPNDPMYPAYYSVGPETRKNEGCNTTFLVNEEKYQKVSSNSSNGSSRSNIAISRQMVSLCLLIVMIRGKIIADFFWVLVFGELKIASSSNHKNQILKPSLLHSRHPENFRSKNEIFYTFLHTTVVCQK